MQSSRVSIAELIDGDILLRPQDAVAIVADICRQYASGSVHGIPNPTVIRLTPDGAVVVEGPHPLLRHRWAVALAAAILLAVAAVSTGCDRSTPAPAPAASVARTAAPVAPPPPQASEPIDRVRRVRKPPTRPSRPARPRESFLKKELFRIVIR
jgi:hypothetical protein